jgi:hypothetical protein
MAGIGKTVWGWECPELAQAEKLRWGLGKKTGAEFCD